MKNKPAKLSPSFLNRNSCFISDAKKQAAKSGGLTYGSFLLGILRLISKISYRKGKQIKAGFTLAEVLVIVIVVAVLVSIAAPLYNKTIRRSRMSDAVHVLEVVSAKQEAYYIDNGTYADDFRKLAVPIKGLKDAPGIEFALKNFTYKLNNNCITAKSATGDYVIYDNFVTHEMSCEGTDCKLIEGAVPLQGSRDCTADYNKETGYETPDLSLDTSIECSKLNLSFCAGYATRTCSGIQCGSWDTKACKEFKTPVTEEACSKRNTSFTKGTAVRTCYPSCGDGAENCEDWDESACRLAKDGESFNCAECGDVVYWRCSGPDVESCFHPACKTVHFNAENKKINDNPTCAAQLGASWTGTYFCTPNCDGGKCINDCVNKDKGAFKVYADSYDTTNGCPSTDCSKDAPWKGVSVGQKCDEALRNAGYCPISCNMYGGKYRVEYYSCLIKYDIIRL
ncbi:MAG: hypothetical protein EZS28_041181 [Streblomastix strix]|uniref:Prepilin-type N-terminal cleavage/methylation domain-containing protein n=1 Tax=Streblomastix strix TaxID=222440 RepID=A0A5J4TZT6_9EUKA|nr:MAG: hypothetical protein EZS28_041181 [Streblomastix strix]